MIDGLLLLPLFTIYFQTNLIDTRWALIVTYTAFGLPLTVFLMAGYFKAVPREVLEASTLDGAKHPWATAGWSFARGSSTSSRPWLATPAWS